MVEVFQILWFSIKPDISENLYFIIVLEMGFKLHLRIHIQYVFTKLWIHFCQKKFFLVNSEWIESALNQGFWLFIQSICSYLLFSNLLDLKH
jgi:hypothetical protein